MSNYFAANVKPFPHASAWLKKADVEISEKMLALTLANQMPAIFDEKYQLVDQPNLEQFKAFLEQSVDAKKKIRENQLYNRKARAVNEQYDTQIAALQAEIAERRTKIEELRKHLIKSKPQAAILLIKAK